jgi:hypothetical protein
MPYLEDVYEEAPADVFDIDDDWVEYVGNTQPGGGGAFSPQGGEDTIVVETTQNKCRSMIRKVLGFAYADNVAAVAGARLHRENPARHPRFPWLRAETVSFSGFPPDASGGTLKGDALVFTGGGPTPPFYAKYQRVYATVRFKSFRWNFVDDNGVATNAAEINRNCYFDPASSVQMLSAEGELGQMRWRETGAGGPTVGEPVKQAFGTLVSKSTLVLHWTRVPHEWVSAAAYPLCDFRKLNACIGTVNSAAFGPNTEFPAGTLLMQPYRMTPYQWQISTLDGDLGFFGWDVQIPLERFDPPQGAAGRGYRTLPWPANLLYYEATRVDGTTHLLRESSFATIFDKAG